MIKEFKDIWELFEKEVFAKDSRPGPKGLFNQYLDDDKRYDNEKGHLIRRENLKEYLKSFEKVPKTILVGEAPGYRGCRFSGVPFTSEKQICDPSFKIFKNGERSSIREKPWSEAAATTFWDTMESARLNFFVWNCVPFHLYDGEKSELNNRAPEISEIEECGEILSDILDCLKPQRIIALGRKAEISLKKLKALKKIEVADIEYIRHPGRGGAREFREKIRKKAYLFPQ